MSAGNSPAQPLAGIVPRHKPSRINEPFPLYRGLVEVVQGSVTAAGTVEVEWAWFPMPEIRFRLDVRPGSAFQLEPCVVKFSLRGVQFPARIIGIETNTTAAGTTQSIKVFFDQAVTFDNGQARTKVQFQVPGFLNYQGLWITDPVTTAPGGTAVSRPGRVVLLGGGWKITLDAVSPITTVIQALDAESGYGLTHVTDVAREDGATFSSADVLSVEDALFDFLSFARGSWSGVVLPNETDSAGNVVFEQWFVPRLAPWRTKNSWFYQTHPAELVNVFPGFWARWSNPQWRDAVKFAIHALVESNSEPISMEASLILAQVALELLSAVILVEDLKRITPQDFDKKNLYPAYRKFQALLTECGIPLTIPPTLVHLSAVAVANNWSDGPTALTQTRNKLAHASLPNLKKLYSITPQVKSDLRTLALWYVELVLLWWCGYKGGYRSRVGPLLPPYQENTVPWALPPGGGAK